MWCFVDHCLSICLFALAIILFVRLRLPASDYLFVLAIILFVRLWLPAFDYLFVLAIILFVRLWLPASDYLFVLAIILFVRLWLPVSDYLFAFGIFKHFLQTIKTHNIPIVPSDKPQTVMVDKVINNKQHVSLPKDMDSNVKCRGHF